MNCKINAKIAGTALAAVSAIAYLFCVILLALSPVLLFKLTKDMFHGVDITKIADYPVALGPAILGFIELIIAAFVLGWLFAVIYNALIKTSK